MKKLLVVGLLCMAMLSTSSFALAAGADDWTNLPGMLVDGNKTPAKLTVTEEGLQIYQSAGYYGDDGNYTGVILNAPVDVSDFSVEFTVDEVPGLNLDSWIGLHLLNKKAYFSVGSPSQSQGLVTLIRPVTEDITLFQTYEHVDSLSQVGNDSLNEKSVGKFKVEFKKNGDGTFTYYVNGMALSPKYEKLSAVFPDGKAYFMMGASTQNGKPTQFTITKVNGKPVAAADANGASNPKTGDTGMIPYIVLTAASLLGMGASVISRRRK